MLAYFTASVSAKEKFLDNYLHIISLLKKHKHTVIADHIINATEEKIRLYSRDEKVKFHDKVEKWIQSCDFVIAETSNPSTSVGYEISLALRYGKPVLILYSVGDPPSLLGQHKDDRLVCEKYTKQTVEKDLTDFMLYVEGKADLRFTFFITPRIIAYLDHVAKTQKIPKSVYLRKLIEEEIKRNNF
ncbi:MAG: hypothetical protein AAB893_00430 [Patescibacteria group bacterium]